MKNTMFGTLLTDRYQLSTSFRVQGSEGFDFDEVSRILKTPPSKALKKGTASRIGKIYETNTWILASDVAEQEPLDSHLLWFTSRYLNPEALRAVRSLNGIEDIDFFCAFSVPPAGCRINLPADLLLSLHSMALDLELSLVFSGPEQVADSVEGRTDTEADWVQAELKERAGAVLRGVDVPSLQVGVLETLKLSSGGEMAALIIASPELERRLDLTLQTHITEGASLDSKLQELGEALRNSVGQISKWVGPDSLLVEGRLETNCEWASASLSHRSFDLAVSLHCPMEIEVAFA